MRHPSATVKIDEINYVVLPIFYLFFTVNTHFSLTIKLVGTRNSLPIYNLYNNLPKPEKHFCLLNKLRKFKF